MESVYSLANTELAEIRRKNKEEQRRREAEVRSQSPELSEVESALSRAGLSLAKGVLNGEKDISAIRRSVEAAQSKKREILKCLGLPEDYLDEIYNCPKCHDRGYDENGRRCECVKRLVMKYVGVNSNLTEVMREQCFDKFDFALFRNMPDIKGRDALSIAKSIYDKALKFSESFEKTKANLFMYGAAGTGKTFVSSCIANRALERGFSVYYQSAFRLLDMFEKLKFGRYDDESEQSASEYAARYVYDVDLLIIDDVGTEFVSMYTSAALFDILNSRLMLGKSTVISSNLSPSKIDEVYGGRLSSRIIGEYEILTFAGSDLRRRKLDKN